MGYRWRGQRGASNIAEEKMMDEERTVQDREKKASQRRAMRQVKTGGVGAADGSEPVSERE